MGKTFRKNDSYSQKYAKFVPKKKFKINKHKAHLKPVDANNENQSGDTETN